MWLAAYNGHELMLGWLLKEGAQVDAKHKVRPVMADVTQHLSAAAGLISWCGVRLLATPPYQPFLLRVSPQFGQSPLYVAAEHGHVGCMRALIAAGADVDGQDQARVTRSCCGAVVVSPLERCGQQQSARQTREITHR